MISFDHVCLAAQNVYEATFRLSRVTGIGNYDGGWFPLFGLGHKVVSLADDIYIEVEGIVDHMVLKSGHPHAKFFEEQTLTGDRFVAWCLRTDSMEELERFAAHHGTVVDTNTLSPESARQMMNGRRGTGVQAPRAMSAWPIGKPNLYYKADLSGHAASLPPEPGTGTVRGQGLEWIEVGETESELTQWLGGLIHPSKFPFEVRYNGRTSGLYALGVKTDAGSVTIRRDSVAIKPA